MDLFTYKMEKDLSKTGPLADRMRPENLGEFVGQRHLLGEDKFLARSIKADRITSMIFYGPPGTGKTTLANIIANNTNMVFEKLSAVTSGVKDIRQVVGQAEENLKIYNKRTILFIDEIHRFNKSQQDALLPFVEKGVLTLIGATTENPYFEVNKALLSRVIVLNLESLGPDDFLILLERALGDKEKALGNMKINIDKESIDYLIKISDGDGRTFLNSLEIGVLSTDEDENGYRNIDIGVMENSIQVRAVRYDKDGDEHYNTVSAFIKSMRGSDPDSSLYWLSKMLVAGEDLKFIARRMIILASEDIGNADPNALVVANNVFQAVHNIGMPEARIILAQGVIYLATAPKSNASYLAIDKAMDHVREENLEVPNHLKDSHYKGADKLGYGKGYKYPHDYENSYVDQDYRPKNYKAIKYYQPTENGYEKSIKEYLEKVNSQ